MIKFRIDVLAALKAAGYSQSRLKRLDILPGGTLDKLRSNGIITTKTLDVVCNLLHCQPGELLEWIPDETDT